MRLGIGNLGSMLFGRFPSLPTYFKTTTNSLDGSVMCLVNFLSVYLQNLNCFEQFIVVRSSTDSVDPSFSLRG